jgi:hypothetical protein
LVYPLTDADAATFERFGNAVHHTVASRSRGGPVHASFHPDMVGDTTSESKLVGFLRRAPDPFVQFIPEGLHQGGSTYIDLEKVDLTSLMAAGSAKADNAKSNFERLQSDDLDRIETTIHDIQRDRDESYAPYLDELRRA